MNLIILSNFMQSLNINRKHYTKSAYFSRHTLFSTIYLLQEQKLILEIILSRNKLWAILYNLMTMICTCMQSLEV
jgi:hypothetical protein